ncbi:hypothetical protein BZA77DRAFT_61521 [Pyronema omphalodes]|nr:hypothetical protein BZA77DRAFT_61521 [Pyronema omphalodes]
MSTRKRITRSSAAPIPATNKAPTNNAGANPAGGKKPAIREAAPTPKVNGTLIGWVEKRPREPRKQPKAVQPKTEPVLETSTSKEATQITELKNAALERLPEITKEEVGAQPVASVAAEYKPLAQSVVATDAEKTMTAQFEPLSQLAVAMEAEEPVKMALEPLAQPTVSIEAEKSAPAQFEPLPQLVIAVEAGQPVKMAPEPLAQPTVSMEAERPVPAQLEPLPKLAVAMEAQKLVSAQSGPLPQLAVSMDAKKPVSEQFEPLPLPAVVKAVKPVPAQFVPLPLPLPAFAVEAGKPVTMGQPTALPFSQSVPEKFPNSQIPKTGNFGQNMGWDALDQINTQFLQAYKLQSKSPIPPFNGFEAPPVAAEAAKGASLMESSGRNQLHSNGLVSAVTQGAPNDLQKTSYTGSIAPLPSIESAAVKTANTDPAPKVGEKRPHGSDADKGVDAKSDSDVDLDDCRWNCNQIRRMIREYLNSGEMKVTEFQKTIRANSNSYGRFMKLKGPWDGNSNNTYYGACRFFMRREKAKKREKEKNKSTKKQKTGEAALPDISNIKLDKEDEDNVEVYDTCDELRKKISLYLMNTGISKTALCRAFAAQFHTRGNASIQVKQLNDFCMKKGPDAGNTSTVFYGGYIYFEKLRIAEGKPKSAFRLQMEKEWGAEGGFNITESSSRGHWMPAGASVGMNQYGKMSWNK